MLKIIGNRAKTTSAVFFVLMMASVTLLANVSVQPVEAQLHAQQPYTGPLKTGDTADITIPTGAYLSFGPNPIGLGQPILLNLWVAPCPATQRTFRDYKVTITKPDGIKNVLTPESYTAEATAWASYIADQVGTWKLKFDFPGMYFPAGYYLNYNRVANTSGNIYIWSMYFEPSSTEEQTLTVQSDMVYSWPPAPLPTDYWTRPAQPMNRAWWSILGNWPSTGYVGGGPTWDELYPDTNTMWSDRYSFAPWVQGPNSAHILWKRQGAIGGLTGGPAGIYSISSSPSSPSVVYAGRCYETVTKPGGDSVARCYDLRTGEIFYEKPTAQGGVTPTIVSYAYPAAAGTMRATGAPSVELLTISGGRLLKVNPWTGALSGNYSISPLTTGTYYTNGGPGDGPYVLSVQDLGAGAANATGGRYRLINWTTRGSSSTLTARIVRNTSYALSNLPSAIDFNTGLGASIRERASEDRGVTGERNDITPFYIYSLSTGQLLYNITVKAYYFSGSTLVADHGKAAMCFEIETDTGSLKGGFFRAWDLTTGKLAWTSEEMEYPWGEFGGYNVQSAYGMIFWSSYDAIYAFDWDTGKIVWKYRSPSLAAFEGPYYTENGTGFYPFRCDSAIADGKIYVWNCEHTESQPYVRGWGLYCLNVTTGEFMWKLSLGVTESTAVGAIVDGYLVYGCNKDGYMYVIGKGKTATTVTAPDVSVPLGTAFTIKGTVLDQSPAQPGTPCVSRESMQLQMEYLHLQQPIDGIWHNETITGVPVSLSALGSDGTYYDIGTTTTDGYYGTFSQAWTPPKQGTFKIIASFASDDSYGSSGAATAVTVGPAPAVTPIPEQIVPADYTMTIIGVGIAVIIAFAIGIAIAVLILRKR